MRMLTHCGFILIFLLAMACKPTPDTLRVATFNIRELSVERLNAVDASGLGLDAQLRAAAEIVQRMRPDVLVINEIDHAYGQFDVDFTGPAQQLVKAYLNTGDAAINYPYVYAAACNTGIPSGRDLNGDGIVAQMGDARSTEFAADCYGWGEYPGQYSMALLSRYPIDTEQVRTFQTFLWKDLPGNHLPADYYQDNAEVLRLSSKSHWDVPLRIGNERLHLLLSHPTPPGFDGPEDRNGRRNFDELKFWVHYLENDPALKDDAGRVGGYAEDEPFLFAGDLNADPANDAVYEGVTAIGQLLHHPRVQDTSPFLTSEGGAYGRQSGAPDYPERYTAQFGEDMRMRIDYLLPSLDIKVVRGGVFWPSPETDKTGFDLAEQASDHRLIWLDITLPQPSKRRE